MKLPPIPSILRRPEQAKAMATASPQVRCPGVESPVRFVPGENSFSQEIPAVVCSP